MRRSRRSIANSCALSVDSLSSHLAWVHSIAQRFGVAIPFPIVEDPTMGIARAYGMLPSGATSSATVRTTFVIDPDGIVRALSPIRSASGAAWPNSCGW